MSHRKSDHYGAEQSQEGNFKVQSRTHFELTFQPPLFNITPIWGFAKIEELFDELFRIVDWGCHGEPVWTLLKPPNSTYGLYID